METKTPETTLRVFDAHTHVYPARLAEKASRALGEFYRLPIPGKGTVDDLIERCRQAGASGFLLLGVATTAEQVGNVNAYLRDCVNLARAEGMEAYAFGGYHPDADPVATVEQILALGLSGVKIHPDIQRFSLDDPRMDRLCEVLEGRLPVCFHMGDDRPEYRYSAPEKLIALMERHPDLRVIAAHLGGYRLWDQAVELYAGQRNVWFDLSSSLPFLPDGRAEEIIRTLGSDRVFFGTDYPIASPAEGIAQLGRLNLTPSERENILWNNFHRFLAEIRIKNNESEEK